MEEAGRIPPPILDKIFAPMGFSCGADFLAGHALRACCVCRVSPLTACSGTFVLDRGAAAETARPVADTLFTCLSLSFAEMSAPIKREKIVTLQDSLFLSMLTESHNHL